jgi:DNA-binding Lrp family transcriptional regulator
MAPAKVGLRSSYRGIARRLGVSPNTVRDRMAKMYASGILGGTSVYVNPSLLALSGGAYAVDVSPELSKEKMLDRIKSMDDLLFIHNFRGSLIGIAFAYADEKDLMKKLAAFNKLVSSKNGGILTRTQYPRCTAELTDPEWKLISRLTERPFRTYTELARELRVSVRTLKRMMNKIVEEGAVLSVPKLDYRAITGGVPADLIVVFGELGAREEAEKRIMNLVNDYMIFIGYGDVYVVYNLVVPKMSMATELALAIKRIEGVKDVRAELVDEHIDITNSLRSRIV